MTKIKTDKMKKHLLSLLAITMMIATTIQAQTITTIAGNGTSGYSGDGGKATSAEISSAIDLAVDSLGNVYFADASNNRIRKITPNGIISTFAGTGVAGYSGDGGQGINAKFTPVSVKIGPNGNFYIVDQLNNCIRKINRSGVIVTIAGNGTSGFSGDGGLATSAQLYQPTCIAIDKIGNIYESEYGNNRIRKIDTSGIINTIAGSGVGGNMDYNGDGSPATSYNFSGPAGLALDNTGSNLYIGDQSNHRVRKLNLATSTISTVAGNGGYSFSGDGGLAVNATTYDPTHIALDANNNLYISDLQSNRIRKVDAITGIINTIVGDGYQAGSGGGYSGDGGSPLSAELYHPIGIVVDADNNIYFCDNENFRIRKVTYTVEAIYSFSPITATTGTTVTIKGKAFIGAYAVSFGGDIAKSFTVINDSTISAVVGNGASGNVVVVSPNGTAGLGGFVFTGLPTNGLIAWYPFNGNANDSSGNGRNGKVYSANNTVKYVNGKNGQGIYLKGDGHVGTQGDYVILPAIGMNKYPSYTISLWVKQDGDADSLFGHGENFIGGHSLSNSCNGTFAFSYQGQAPAFQFGYGNGYVGGNSVYTTGDLGNWVLHTLVIASGTAHCYKNGVLFATMKGSTNTDAESEIGVGTHWFCSGGTQSTRFLGGIDDIRIYNRALDSLEVQTIYNQGGHVVPVLIENITSTIEGKAVKLNWKTATEISTSYYTIQKSSNGTSYLDIGIVKATGIGDNNYEFSDNNPANGINYYRLQSVDKDGSISYSKVVSVNFGNSQSFAIIPNPARDFATINFSKAVDKATLAVYDITGKQVITQSLNSSANTYKLNTQSLKSGLYVIKVNTTTGSFNEKLLLSK